jgi:hypothetical protein
VRRASILLCALFAAAGLAQQPQPDLGRLAASVGAAADIASLTTLDADADGSLRWVAWQEGVGEGQVARLALFRSGTRPAPQWVNAWPDGYAPRLQTLPQWTYRGRDVASVIVQFGAGAVEVALFGLERDGRVVALAREEGADAEVRRGRDGVPVLAILQRDRATLRASCFGWRSVTARLTPTRCPA